MEYSDFELSRKFPILLFQVSRKINVFLRRAMFLILGHKDPPLNKAQIMTNMYIYRTDQKIACSLVQEDYKTSQLLENPQYIQ
jgi:hypothetical protein